MTALVLSPEAAGMSAVTTTIDLSKRGAAMSAVSLNTVSLNTVTLNSTRTTRPSGFDGAVFRLGLTLVAWSRTRADRRRPTPESNRVALERDRMLRARETDALSSALMVRTC